MSNNREKEGEILAFVSVYWCMCKVFSIESSKLDYDGKLLNYNIRCDD